MLTFASLECFKGCAADSVLSPSESIRPQTATPYPRPNSDRGATEELRYFLDCHVALQIALRSLYPGSETFNGHRDRAPVRDTIDQAPKPVRKCHHRRRLTTCSLS